ncbi:hypothetical protein JZ751_005912 [Albula glossodonta]|uniref:Uncharacterized protein n=1 Tax=Albula glossodonta TaxID=121402 RepID=A0A8T2P345_9TELE|nr:hypothetical protein JZ751_005912 [Albula glossodonta]
MPIAVRKRSWEEHVTPRTGLQYSFDDLDILCSRGIAYNGRKSGAEDSKSGRRERCASLPECCHGDFCTDRVLFTHAQANTVDVDENANHQDPSHSLSVESGTETLVHHSDNKSPDGSSPDGRSGSSSPRPAEPERTGPRDAQTSGDGLPPAETPGEEVDTGDDGSCSEDESERSDDTVRSPFEEGLVMATGSSGDSSDEGPTHPTSVECEKERAAIRIDPCPGDTVDAKPTEALGNVSKNDAIPCEASGQAEALPHCATKLSPSADNESEKTVMEECNNPNSESDMITDMLLSEVMHVPDTPGECKAANLNISMINEEPSSDTVDAKTTEHDKPEVRVDVVNEGCCVEEAGCSKAREESNNTISKVDASEVPCSTKNTETEAELNDQKAEDGAVKLRKRKGTDLATVNGGDAFHAQKVIPHMIYSALTASTPVAVSGVKPKTGSSRMVNL